MQWKHYIAAIAAKGVSQSQLAKLAGCGQATISDLASGKTLEPRHSLGVALIRIGRRYGVKASTLVSSSTEPTASEVGQIGEGA